MPKQAEAKRDGVINPQNYNYNKFQHIVVYLREHQKVTNYFTKLLIERLKPDTISSKTKWDIKLNLVLDDDK